jgi:uncharacterized membrane protein YhaH (DUF805 family)
MSFVKVLYSFNGRIGRKSFWLGILAAFAHIFIGAIVLATIRPLSGHIPEVVFPVVFALMIIPFLWIRIALYLKRAHDLGWSSWVVFLSFVPAVGFVLLILLGTRKGASGSNQYGDDPLNPGPLEDSFAPSPTGWNR